MKDEIKNIINAEIVTSELFCVVKKTDVYEVRKLNSHENLDTSIKNLISESVTTQFLSEDKECLDITQITSKKDVIYEANLEDLAGLNFMSFNDVGDYVAEDGDFKAFVVKVSNGEKGLYCFQYIYPTAYIKRYGKIPFFREQEQYREIHSNIMVLEGRIDFIVLENKVYVQNWKLLESKFGFTDFIKTSATETINSLKKLDLLENIDKLVNEANKKIPVCKQLMKAKNSAVFKRNRDLILNNAKNIEQYQSLFNENGKLVANTIASVKLFIKLLNDDMLYSKLTEESYDASDKVLINSN